MVNLKELPVPLEVYGVTRDNGKNTRSMKNKWHTVIIGMGLFTIGFFTGSFVGKKVEIEKPNYKPYEDSIQKLNLRLVEFQKNETVLVRNQDSLNDLYAKTRLKVVDSDSLSNSLYNKGVREFGKVGTNPKPITALIYGNQFADNYPILIRRLANQKASVTTYVGIVSFKDSIIVTQANYVKALEANSKAQVRKGRRQGFIIGGIVVGALILLL